MHFFKVGFFGWVFLDGLFWVFLGGFFWVGFLFAHPAMIVGWREFDYRGGRPTQGGLWRRYRHEPSGKHSSKIDSFFIISF